MRDRRLVREQIRARVAYAKRVGIRTRRRPVPRQLFPKAVVVSYFQAIRRILDYARALVQERIEPRLEGWAREFRRDAAADEVDSAIAEVSKQIVDEFGPARLKALALQYGEAASEFQRGQLQRQIKAVLGVDLLAAEPDLAPRLATFAAENAALIKSVPAQALSQIEALVLRGVQAGARHEDIAADIAERFDVAEDRAALIARDQVGKLVSAVDRERQTALGVERFTWATAGDERVRESHAELDGETFDWDDPPEVDGEKAIPGEPINCRCQAIPILDDLLS